MSIKDWLAEKKIPGTIRFYGTPAEEGGGGKVYMARAGVFQDVDAVLSWHPGDTNVASKQSSLAITAAKFRFYGKPAHAAAAPDLGRSALDGLMVMANASGVPARARAGVHSHPLHRLERRRRAECCA